MGTGSAHIRAGDLVATHDGSRKGVVLEKVAEQVEWPAGLPFSADFRDS